MSSIKKTTHKKKSLVKPTQQEVNNLLMAMTMDQIRATDVFKNMQKSFRIRGKVIPKSALRRNDLAIAYLMNGGSIIHSAPKQLQHYKPSKKKSSLHKKHDNFEHQKKLNHGNLGANDSDDELMTWFQNFNVDSKKHKKDDIVNFFE